MNNSIDSNKNYQEIFLTGLRNISLMKALRRTSFLEYTERAIRRTRAVQRLMFHIKRKIREADYMGIVSGLADYPFDETFPVLEFEYERRSKWDNPLASPRELILESIDKMLPSHEQLKLLEKNFERFIGPEAYSELRQHPEILEGKQPTKKKAKGFIPRKKEKGRKNAE
jgi:hypothetical protein